MANITPKINMILWYHNLSSFHATGPGEGTNRGNEFQAWFKFTFNKFLSGHVLYDYFIPGDFYPDGSANAQFFRLEVMYTFASN